MDNDNIIDGLCKSIINNFHGSVLFIIGAGASKEGNVKLSSELVGEMRSGNDALFDQMLQERGIVNTIDAPFEMIMSLYNEIHDEEAGYDFLKLRMPDKEDAYTNPVLFTYEVIAHMFYFRITRHIISLNFDELLERSLHDEVGRQGYRRIHSRSAFERLIVTEALNDRFQRFLFKPHGTISYRMTLRHTWNDVMRLDKEKKKVLSNVVGETPIIIAVGYGFNDRDIRPLILSSLINKTDSENKKLYIITKRDKKGRISNSIKDIAKNEDVHIIDCGSEIFFEKLSLKLFQGDFDKYYPGIQKHRARYLINKELIKRKYCSPGMIEEIDLIIKKINKNEIKSNLILIDNKIEENEKIIRKIHYLFIRLSVDILLFIATVKGKFRSTVLLESDRIKRYVEALQGYIAKLYPKDIQGIIYEKYNINTALKYFNEVFLEKKSEELELHDEMMICKKDENSKIIDEEYLAERLLKCLKIVPSNAFYKEIMESLKEITETIDISLIRETTRLIQFNRPWIICNFKEFSKQTDKIMRKSKHIKIIAETGEWVERIFKGKADYHDYLFKSIHILISDYTDEKEGFHKERASRVFRFLNNELNNKLKLLGRKIYIQKYKKNDGDIPHHMTIGDKQAIYFYRYGRSISVCPILLTSTGDKKTLIEYFEYKWKESHK